MVVSAPGAGSGVLLSGSVTSPGLQSPCFFKMREVDWLGDV